MDELCKLLEVLKEKNLTKTHSNLINSLIELYSSLYFVNEEVNDIILDLLKEGKYDEVSDIAKIPIIGESIGVNIESIVGKKLSEISDIKENKKSKPEKNSKGKNGGYNLYTNCHFFNSQKPYKMRIFDEEYDITSWSNASSVLFKYLETYDKTLLRTLIDNKKMKGISHGEKPDGYTLLYDDIYSRNRNTHLIVRRMVVAAKEYSKIIGKDICANVEIFLYCRVKEEVECS